MHSFHELPSSREDTVRSLLVRCFFTKRLSAENMIAAVRITLAFSILVLSKGVQSHGVWRQTGGQPQPAEVSCNDLFTVDHESYYQKRYEGTMQIKSDVTQRDVEIDIRFDREVDLLVNYFGVSRSLNNRDFRIVKQGYSLYAHSVLPLKLEVSYSTTLPPRPAEVRLNGIIICPLISVRAAIHEDQTPVYRYPPTSWNLDMNVAPSTGVPLVRPSVDEAARPSSSRNFTDSRENKFNSTCQAMNPNIVLSPGRWDGILTLNTDVTVDRVRIEIVFDRSIYILGNFFGQVSTTDNTRFVITNDTLILAADSEVKMQVFVKFSEVGRVPDVREVLFNSKDLCRQRKRRVSTITEAPSEVFASQPQPITERSNIRSSTSGPESEEEGEYDENDCATVSSNDEPKVRSRIIGGNHAKSGDIPWHVAIFHDDQYQCGGSIISRRIILTAAHCLTKENSNRTLEVDLLKVYIGLVDISTREDFFNYAVTDVAIHMDYNAALHTTDIGILKLGRDIVFNNFIKPVCLYSNTTDISTLYSRYGKVAGWGLNRDGIVTNTLNYLDMPVVSQKKCSRTNVQYSTVLAYGESFCAGHADGNSVCNGDSGGGLVFVENYRYHLRGIVSISAQKRNQLMCDPNRYSVFTDVSKFLKWIRQNMK
ncbi:transmembrane protease serine 11B-like [Toxorhynchites rutilus septentrionalis]|uniref:transmembrane protease serine 11B-like n=1 Tax=Toxorhynchites rutilus septentrionalis TaxID=329112 RepID=UPI00247B140C|nr:transmembrane protease serine 11B-like [Toxorhynchites rutilus septentrionalis]